MIHRISCPERYEWVGCVDGDDYEIFRTFDGSSRASTWRPVRMKWIKSDGGRRFKSSDFPWLGTHVLIMRRRAVDALSDMLEAGGEILPLATDDGVELFVLNVTRVLDVLDEEHSTIDRFEDSGQIMFIEAAAFHEDLVRGVDFFKLPGRACGIFVGERFIERVRAAGLVGLDFPLAWSPEGGPVKRRLW